MSWQTMSDPQRGLLQAIVRMTPFVAYTDPDTGEDWYEVTSWVYGCDANGVSTRREVSQRHLFSALRALAKDGIIELRARRWADESNPANGQAEHCFTRASESLSSIRWRTKSEQWYGGEYARTIAMYRMSDENREAWERMLDALRDKNQAHQYREAREQLAEAEEDLASTNQQLETILTECGLSEEQAHELVTNDPWRLEQISRAYNSRVVRGGFVEQLGRRVERCEQALKAARS